MTRRTLLAVVPNTRGTSPGQRTSIEAWEPVLADAGWDVQYAEYADARLEDLLRERGRVPAKAAALSAAYARQASRIVRTALDYDAVYVYREAALLGPALLERYMLRRGVPFVYELDDPLHIPYDSPVNGAFARLKFFGKVSHLCRLADAVVVNSRPLEDYAGAHNRNVWRIPSLIDERRYPLTAHRSVGNAVCIGWIGSHTTMTNVSLIAPVLRRLQEETSVEFRMVGAGAADLPGVDVVTSEWTETTEVDVLRAFDIGIAPIPAAPWNEWKFFYKIAQYMALGLPSVASARRSVSDQIDHGENGFIADDLDGWHLHLSALVTDAALRQRLGEAAAEKARAHYTVAANAEKIRSVFESLPDRHRSIAR